jgi:hypothetical protein
VPWCLPNTADRHNGWRGLFGRLDKAGHFPTSTTDPQPMGKVGQVFHPDQDRIVSVRECARSQGFPDTFFFSGNVHNRHRCGSAGVRGSPAWAEGLPRLCHLQRNVQAASAKNVDSNSIGGWPLTWLTCPLLAALTATQAGRQRRTPAPGRRSGQPAAERARGHPRQAAGRPGGADGRQQLKPALIPGPRSKAVLTAGFAHTVLCTCQICHISSVKDQLYDSDSVPRQAKYPHCVIK